MPTAGRSRPRPGEPREHLGRGMPRKWCERSQEQVKLVRCGEFRPGGHVTCPLHRVTVGREQPTHDPGRVHAGIEVTPATDRIHIG